MVRVDKTKDFLERIRLAGVTKYYPSTQEDYENMQKMDENLEKVRRDYIVKDYLSELDAQNCYFTA